MSDCIDLMSAALGSITTGTAVMPERQWVPIGTRNASLLSMPAAVGQAVALKAITLGPENPARGLPAIQGVVLVFDPDTGEVVAILDAAAVTEIRTGAVSGLATRLLAAEDAATAGILGAGVQARWHLEAMRAVRPIERVAVWSRRWEQAEEFARAMVQRHGIVVEAVRDAKKAVEGQAIVCTVTGADKPVLRGDWLREGTHVNAVGVSGLPRGREVDSTAVARSRVFVDSAQAALAETGDLAVPLEEGVLKAEGVTTLGAVVMGQAPGRQTGEEITLFKSVGLAVEDAVAGAEIYRRAVRDGVGSEVNLFAQ